MELGMTATNNITYCIERLGGRQKQPRADLNIQTGGVQYGRCIYARQKGASKACVLFDIVTVQTAVYTKQEREALIRLVGFSVQMNWMDAKDVGNSSSHVKFLPLRTSFECSESYHVELSTQLDTGVQVEGIWRRRRTIFDSALHSTLYCMYYPHPRQTTKRTSYLHYHHDSHSIRR